MTAWRGDCVNISNYENLVTYRHSLKPKYMAFVRLILSHLLALGATVDSILFAFDLDNAAGVNLDTIGEIVGMNRLLPYVPTSGTRILTDDEYRMLIRLKIARNAWDGRNERVQEIYRTVFPTLAIEYTDNQDMTVTLTVKGGVYNREAEIMTLSGALLVPAGVGYRVVIEAENTSYTIYTGVTAGGERLSDVADIGARTTWGDVLDAETWETIREKTWLDLV